ncbi:uncharacterized protein LOC119610583 [Lucilia sericata]|uniref:uncharacterized protein LOC119610583 n=1 Tax=Lucilia sericata TaxID=13632 RepID=UPI0018A85A64|nr:uncharacterized protein LOC119610583 [Lucilia sericata]
MIVDKSENMGEHAWTKLLDDKDSTGKGAVIVKMSNKTDNSLLSDVQNLQNSKETSPLTGGLIDTTNTTNTTTTAVTARKVSTGDLVSMETGKDGATECLTKFTRNGEEKNVSIQRKESILGTFHRHLRRSIKAVSESPGPITRYRQTRFSSRRVRKRVIFKHGDCNVVQGNVAKRRRRYLQVS